MNKILSTFVGAERKIHMKLIIHLSGAHRCIKCDRSIHVVCGTVLSDEGYDSKVLCPNCKTDNNRHRSGSMDNQLKQAIEHMRNYLYYSVREFFLIVVSWTFISHLCI
jgi:hypothetical protein